MGDPFYYDEWMYLQVISLMCWVQLVVETLRYEDLSVECLIYRSYNVLEHAITSLMPHIWDL
ncbi:hypothetical protein APE02nite_13050 [Alkalibacterium pelagium]|uniref:Uncharacterized protein n=1 Tax=Alkalibacterium pelagium TaxID=426702 RepID=A0A1H7KUV3_9LACT|nr:hypothetical protein APE02nite_13050 [Alkalibacterium pelagium]SEK89845.1 hypothetical protein SAMN04488099_10833 [Alkalibacterium pelagium]